MSFILSKKLVFLKDCLLVVWKIDWRRKTIKRDEGFCGEYLLRGHHEREVRDGGDSDQTSGRQWME